MSQSRLLSLLVENRPGVLQRVASMIRRRGFNIDELSVGPTEDPSVSRMTITVHVGQQAAEQATKQLSKLIDVITIDDITDEPVVAHELVLIKVSAPPARRHELLDVVKIYRGRVIDVAPQSVIVELTGSFEKVDSFIELMRPYGIKELARSGEVAMVRGDEARLSVVEIDQAALEQHRRNESDLLVADAAADSTGNI